MIWVTIPFTAENRTIPLKDFYSPAVKETRGVSLIRHGFSKPRRSTARYRRPWCSITAGGEGQRGGGQVKSRRGGSERWNVPRLFVVSRTKSTGGEPQHKPLPLVSWASRHCLYERERMRERQLWIRGGGGVFSKEESYSPRTVVKGWQ